MYMLYEMGVEMHKIRYELKLYRVQYKNVVKKRDKKAYKIILNF